ncbi:MAG: DNA primase [Candidatus Aminicenantes bacterium]|nr:DNA primase [Candidatus Aminicenantes bacterium]
MEITDQIRQTANIIEIASEYTTVRRRGNKYIGLCPFHSEKTPSFTIDEAKQLYHCFGCGAGGDIFTLVMEKENLTFPEAVRYLAEKYNIPIPEKKKYSPEKIQLEKRLYHISNQALDHFKKNLFHTPEGKKALQYLQTRKISEKLIQTFQIGYALNSWDSLLNFFNQKGVAPDLLEKAGLVLRRQGKEGHYDRFRGRIIFPIFTLTGKVAAFGGRTIFEDDPKYLNSPDTLIYSKGSLLYGLNFTRDKVREKGKIILVEGYMDFLTLMQAGIENTAASLGTSLTHQQVSLASRFAPLSIISYDGDSAGRKAALRGVSLYFEKGAQVKVINLPEGSDPDSYIHKYGEDKFNQLVENSQSGIEFLIHSHKSRGHLTEPEEKSRIAKIILEQVEKISDPFIRSDYISKISEHLSLDENELRALIKHKSLEDIKNILANFLPAEKRLLQILFEDSEVAAWFFKDIKDLDYTLFHCAPILNILAEFFNEGKNINFSEFKEKINPKLFRSLSEILQEKSPPCSREEAEDCIDSLRKYNLEKKRIEIKSQIQILEKQGKKDKIAILLKQSQTITEELAKHP